MKKHVTRIATSDETSITVRGKDLVNELIGNYSYTEMLYFLIRDRFPTPSETKIFDACLVTLMEAGLTPSSLVSRLIIDSVPDEAQVAISAGLLAIGNVFVGTMEGCARVLATGVEGEIDPKAYCRQTVAEYRAQARRLPGFGHPTFKDDDPRVDRLFRIAMDAGAKGDYIQLLRALGVEIDRSIGRHLTINATGAIAALLLEIGLPVAAMRGIAVVSRSGGLIGHILEEKATGSARHLWRVAEDEIPYEDPSQTPG